MTVATVSEGGQRRKLCERGFETTGGQEVVAFLERILELFFRVTDEPEAEDSDAHENCDRPAEVHTNMQDVKQQRFEQQKHDDRGPGKHCDVFAGTIRHEQYCDDGKQHRGKPFHGTDPGRRDYRTVLLDVSQQCCSDLGNRNELA